MKLAAIIMELLGIAVIGGGIGIELAYEADVGFLVITIGSLLVAGGGVIWGKFIKQGGK